MQNFYLIPSFPPAFDVKHRAATGLSIFGIPIDFNLADSPVWNQTVSPIVSSIPGVGTTVTSAVQGLSTLLGQAFAGSNANWGGLPGSIPNSATPPPASPSSNLIPGVPNIITYGGGALLALKLFKVI